MWITLEGNISVGKSTLIPKLAKYLGWQHLDERVEQDPEFQDLLARYYKDNTVSIHLQTWLTHRRFSDIKRLSTGSNLMKNHLVERSIFGDIVFTKVNAELGNITLKDYETYFNLAVECLHSLELPKMIIYLKADPGLCFKRAMERNRECEEGLTLDYLNILHDGYRTIMKDMARVFKVPIVTIPYDNFCSVDEVVKQCWLQTL